MEIISNIALISINSTLLVQVASFLIFLFIMNRIMFSPLIRTMADRESFLDRIRGDIDNAERELDKVSDLLRVQEDTIRDKAKEIRKDLEESGNREAGRIFSEAKREIEVMKEEAERDIEEQIVEAKKHIKEESERLAVSIMEKILDRRLA